MTTPASPLVHFPVAAHGRWLVCYQVPGTRMRQPVEDCPSLAAALGACRRRNGEDDGEDDGANEGAADRGDIFAAAQPREACA